MTSLLEQTKSVRKTFTIPNYIVKELEEYARSFGKKQSQVIASALEEFLHKKHNKVNKRLEALDALTAIAPKGSLKGLDTKALRAQKTLDAH